MHLRKFIYKATSVIAAAMIFTGAALQGSAYAASAVSPEKQAEDIKTQIEEVSSEIEELSGQKSELVSSMSERIVYYYMHSSSTEVLDTIIGSDSFAEMLNAIAQQQEMYEYDAAQLEEYESTVTALKQKQEDLYESLDELYEAYGRSFDEDERLALVREAVKYIGVPYVWGGASPSGFDCSGLVIYCANHCGVGMEMERVSAEGIRAQYCNEISEDELEPGDLIFFKGTYSTSGASHMAIYLGEGLMLHASGNAVHISSTDETYWENHFMQYGRLKM